ncbi:phosphotransferase [Streptomyces sp. B1866]|uniref:maltokinase N-terminal cap-like domain-containing protein n=1 Tax=Streptomyces sp. B1866 TaxID=3075431 RepID=UPI0028908213|nr:phosphotransferase [Streptomyces sp. B1866]MDT3399458.1 phosphotransferase [Streptomyces sp. B1866]
MPEAASSGGAQRSPTAGTGPSPAPERPAAPPADPPGRPPAEPGAGPGSETTAGPGAGAAAGAGAALPADPPEAPPDAPPDTPPGAPPGGPAGGPDGPAGLLESLTPLLTEWLPRQRWFAGKGRPVTGFSLVSALELLPCSGAGSSPGLLHLLVRAEQHGRPGQTPAPQGGAPSDDCYQILLGVRATLPPRLATALVGRPSGGPLHGRAVYEALLDPRLASLLLERLRVPGRLGPLRFVREPATAIPSALAPRLVTAEQSNSSVVYGDAYILKLFRRVSPGVNPDLEVPLALARAGSSRVPAPTAWFEADAPRQGADAHAEPYTLGVLQPYLAESVDGWQLAQRALAERSDFTPAVHALGGATAEVHLAMARALPTAELRRAQIEHLAAAMTERLDATAAAVPALLPYRDALASAYEDLAAAARAGRTVTAQRIHGDLHLGQALRTPGGGWCLIDFEGEPSRPLAERRRPQPAVRDIAGMLRSFDYAAHAGELDRPEEWARRTRAAYCAGYAEVSGTDPRDEPELLRAHETDKAVYEVLYEARHRPEWLPIPMAAIRRLAAGPDRPGPDDPGGPA